ncbi:MAG: glycoside hydrolase family 5 protein [Lachnospiraceae bacterium]|nr:glycoside hydrolase family 5 protein [Lachnospiraceae bacterium]
MKQIILRKKLSASLKNTATATAVLAVVLSLTLTACGTKAPESGAADTAGEAVTVEEGIIGEASVYEGNLIGEASQYEGEADSEATAAGNASTVDEASAIGEASVYEGSKPEDTSVAGPLHVSKTFLCDSSGAAVNLRGVSTHGINYYPEYVNKDAFRTLRDDWGVNLIRLAMYTQEAGGYLSGGDQNAQLAIIDNGVSYAEELGMYVIIDWHILSDGNPTQHQTEAVEFFDMMSSKYKDKDNVIYEICNEPQNSPWTSVIRPYAEEVISAIRKNDKDAVVLVGTNNWSQYVDEVIGNELNDDNVMYCVHFYAATHRDDLRQRVQKALSAGVPVFISECSICDASGNGDIDYDSADKWLELIDSNHIPYVIWNLSNKNESSALIRPDCTKLSDWSESELSSTGQYFREHMRAEN